MMEEEKETGAYLARRLTVIRKTQRRTKAVLHRNKTVLRRTKMVLPGSH